MYKHEIHLVNGQQVKVTTPELPTLSEQNLLHFARPNGDNLTFVLENVSYFHTRQGV